MDPKRFHHRWRAFAPAATLLGLVRLARPRDWVKNVFVVLPVPFALTAGAHLAPGPFLLGLLGFCLVNSAIYTLNDLADAPADRFHPQKRRRPWPPARYRRAPRSGKSSCC